MEKKIVVRYEVTAVLKYNPADCSLIDPLDSLEISLKSNDDAVKLEWKSAIVDVEE